MWVLRSSVRSRLWYFLSPLDGASVREAHCEQASTAVREAHCAQATVARLVTLTYFAEVLRCPHKRIVTITKVYIAKNNIHVELIRFRKK